MRRKLKSIWYKMIRRWVLGYDAFTGIDPNEDFKCGTCLEPVLRRSMFCSSDCYFKTFQDLEPSKELIKETK